MNTVIKTGGKKLCVKFRLIRFPSQGPFVLFTDISRIDVKPLSYKISYKNTAVSDRLAQSNDLHWKLIVEKKQNPQVNMQFKKSIRPLFSSYGSTLIMT